VSERESEFEMRLQQHMQAVERYLVGPHDDPQATLAEIDAAIALSEHPEGMAPEEAAGLRLFLTVYRHLVSGMSLSRRPEDFDSASREVLRARELFAEFKARYPGRTDDPGVRTIGITIEINLLQLKQVNASDEERKNLKATIAQLLNEMVGLNPNPAMRDYFEGLEIFKKVWPIFVEAGHALGRMNLEDAARFVDEATELIGHAEASFAKAGKVPFVMEQPLKLIKGFSSMVKAQSLHIRAFRDAVLGQAHDGHKAELLKADGLLREGASEIEQAMPGYRRFAGPSAAAFPLEQIKSSIADQREVIRNLARLVERAVKPRELVRRSYPKFFVYFLATFVLLLVAVKSSGLRTDIGKEEILGLALLSFLVSATTSFGYEIGLKFLIAAKNFFTVRDVPDKVHQPG
jgi:hypothetical protein